MTSPFHAGEQAVQRRLGVRDAIEPWARKVVRPQLTHEHQVFFAQLPFLVAAARDGEGRPWATLLAGSPGFARAEDARTLDIAAAPVRGDALEGALRPGSDLGLLGIELATRRRNRVNGRVAHHDEEGLVLAVEQSFGNCPQYIHERDWYEAEPASAPEPEHHRKLTPKLMRWIEGANTLFIATGHRGEGESAAFGMDASHRGGEPGFVRALGPRTLVLPDYAGNNHFNTIGNLQLDPRAGLLFVDFEQGSLLQLTGRVVIDWDSPALAAYPGAHRLLRFELDEAIELAEALPLRFREVATASRLRVVEKIRESEDVTSFVLAPEDGTATVAFEPGQHLPIEIESPGLGGRVRRTYSLSSGASDDHYRISVKRDPRGLVSRHLHDRLERGDILEARTPAGEFFLQPGARPVVLLSAGVGLTPMVSMLRDLAAGGDPRPVWFVHGARDGAHHALGQEVRRLAAGHDPARVHVAYSRPAAGDVLARDYHCEGRVDAGLVARLLPDLDADFYLCGPTAFMASLREGLEELGAEPERIRFESFGPAAG